MCLVEMQKRRTQITRLTYMLTLSISEEIKNLRIVLCHLWYVSCELISFYDRRSVASHHPASHVTQKLTTR